MKKIFNRTGLTIISILILSFTILQWSNCSSDPTEVKKKSSQHTNDDQCDGHEGHDHSDQIPSVKITKEQADQFGIKITKVVKGSVNRTIQTTGEIHLNEEKVAHIVAQLNGIAHNISVKVGNNVKKGQVMAILESRELAETKSNFLAAKKREQLAYEFFQREERLWKKKVSSEQEYLTAQQSLAEALIEKNLAQQQLLALGISQNSIDDMPESANSLLSRLEIRAPISGQVLEKHLTLGESVESSANIFMIADLSTVWLDLSVSQENLSALSEELPIEIELPGSKIIKAKISYISPVINHETRTALVRAIIKNKDGSLRPGMFVQASIQVPSENQVLLVPKGSIQMIHDHPSVFVWNKGVFEIREILPGVSDRGQTEILKGLRAEELVVAENAFHLKAEYIKSAAGDLGDHHGHSH